MSVAFMRLLRTSSSERFLVQREGADIASLDIHYLADGRVAGTVCVFDSAGLANDAIPDLLQQIDETLLPDVSFKDRNLSFTVVRGNVVGNFEASEGKKKGKK